MRFLGEGSSPLARGLRVTVAKAGNVFRIIPARAGFTQVRPPEPSGRRDHPRSRGVYRYPSMVNMKRGGSSPLARGLLILGRRGDLVNRIIPARAGFTGRRRQEQVPQWDHPRSRGVYDVYLNRDGVLTGSSPLARGLPAELDLRRVGRRIIPARAGFTDDEWSRRPPS